MLYLLMKKVSDWSSVRWMSEISAALEVNKGERAVEV